MMRTSLLVPALLGSLLLAPATLAQKGSPADLQQAAFLTGPSWSQFLAEAGGSWEVRWCAATGTPSAIFGSGIALADWRGNTIDEARRQALQLLQQHNALLGLGTSEFREAIGARMGRTWSFKFDQWFGGLPVIGGRADVRVHMVGRVPMFGAVAVPIAADFVTTPAIPANTATAAARQHFGLPAEAANMPAPRLVIWADVRATTPQQPVLCWDVRVGNPADANGMMQRVYVDAANGKVVHTQDDRHECGPHCAHTLLPNVPAAKPVAAVMPSATSSSLVLSGDAPELADAVSPLPVPTTLTVRGWARTGVNDSDPLTLVPMGGMQLDIPGVGLVTANDNGTLAFDIATTTTVTILGIDGRHHQTIAGTSAPSGSFPLTPGGNYSLDIFDATATDGRCAHATTSYWIDQSNRRARAILGDTPQLATASQVQPIVNYASTCNAIYRTNTLVFFAAGGGCINTAQPSIVAHEWAHGLDDQYGGVSTVGGLSEGWADLFAEYLTDQPIIGGGFQGVGTFLRTGNNTLQYPNGTFVHEQGQSWMGFGWKLREKLRTQLGATAALALTNEIVIGSIVADATTQPDAVLQVFVADDNDGNLTNGTPHAAQLVWAAQQHSLPTPTASVVANDECSAAYTLVDGLNGPFSNAAATTSAGSVSCAPVGKDMWFLYPAAAAGTLTVSTCTQAAFDTVIAIYSGSCGALAELACNDDTCNLQSTVSANVTPGVYWIRVGGYNSASGAFSLDVTGPGQAVAESTPFGTGCGASSNAFYELFPPGAFDLANTGFRLVPQGSGYVALPGATWITPPLIPIFLVLSDESEQAVPIVGSFPFPGGSTSTLWVCSNGYVSMAGGNPIASFVSAGDWVDSPVRRYGMWADLTPATSTVKLHYSGNLVCVTWDNVTMTSATGTARFQLQFDRTSGAVGYVFQNVDPNGTYLVGCAGQGPNVNLGNRDLSAALPTGLAFGQGNRAPLRLRTSKPAFGSTLTWTTSEFAPTSGLGAQILSLTRVEPGVSLDFFGMPGCYVFVGLDVIIPLVPTAGQATYTMPIANDPALAGAQVSGQSVSFLPGFNAAGIVSSNGVTVTVGW